MNMDKSGNIIGDKEMGKMIAAEFSGAVIQSVLNKMDIEELRKQFSDINIYAIATNPVQDPETNQISADQVKVGINLNFK